MSESRIGLTVRLSPDVAHAYKLALVKRREKVQEVLSRMIESYIEETDKLEKENKL